MGRSIRPYDEGDVMAFCFSAGGAGYGDPLEADPEDVARDFVGGLISAWTMREIYKVAYDEVEQVVLDGGDRGSCATDGARGTGGARHGLGDLRGRVVAAVAARGPARVVRLLARGRRHGAGHENVSALDDALAGRPVDRPLRAPLFAALAAEVEELDVREFLGDPGRRARIYADLARSLRAGRAGGRQRLRLGRRGGGHGPRLERRLPARARVVVGARRDRRRATRAPMVDLLRRVRAVVPEPTLLATTICGPATYAVGQGSLADGARITLAYARAVAEAGADVVFVRESEPELPDGYARAVTPLWGALKFVRAVGVLRAPWAAELPRGPFLPCVDRAAVDVAARAGRRAGRGRAGRTRRGARHPH